MESRRQRPGRQARKHRVHADRRLDAGVRRQQLPCLRADPPRRLRRHPASDPGPAGPPDDNAPEVITGCQAGSTDTAYDLNTGAQLGSKPCGKATNPPEQLVCTPTCNTNSDTLDYMATPSLASYEEVGVIETIPTSTYVSGTAMPPQLSSITVTGNQATFNYFGNVICQNPTSSNTVSQFSYATPYTNINASDPNSKIYASSISCPPSGGGNFLTVTWSSTIPVSSGARFKYETY